MSELIPHTELNGNASRDHELEDDNDNCQETGEIVSHLDESKLDIPTQPAGRSRQRKTSKKSAVPVFMAHEPPPPKRVQRVYGLYACVEAGDEQCFTCKLPFESGDIRLGYCDRFSMNEAFQPYGHFRHQRSKCLTNAFIADMCMNCSWPTGTEDFYNVAGFRDFPRKPWQEDIVSLWEMVLDFTLEEREMLGIQDVRKFTEVELLEHVQRAKALNEAEAAHWDAIDNGQVQPQTEEIDEVAEKPAKKRRASKKNGNQRVCDRNTLVNSETGAASAESVNEDDEVENGHQQPSKSAEFGIYRCDRCELAFDQKIELNQHKVTHLSEDQRPQFQCMHPGCGKFFTQAGHLTVHAKKHLPEDQQPRFECVHPGCGKFFTKASHLTTHVKKHLPEDQQPRFECAHPGCGKFFTEAGHLARHVTKHLPEDQRPRFDCMHPGCGKFFTEAGHLRGHLKNVHKL